MYLAVLIIATMFMMIFIALKIHHNQSKVERLPIRVRDENASQYARKRHRY